MPSGRRVERQRRGAGGGARGLGTARARDRDERSDRGRAARRARPRPAWRRAHLRRRRAPVCACRGCRARRGPPSGECAITAMPSSAQRSTIPPRSARSSWTLSATSTAAIGASSIASSSCRRFTFDRPTRSTMCWSSRRASAPHGGSPGRPRVRGVDQVQVDRQTVERGEARLAVGEDRLRAAVRDPGAGRAGSSRPWSRSADARGGFAVPARRPRAAARCDRGPPRRVRMRARCRIRSRPPPPRPRSSSARGPRRARSRSTGACSRGRCGAPRRQASQRGSGAVAYVTNGALTLTLGEAAHWRGQPLQSTGSGTLSEMSIGEFARRSRLSPNMGRVGSGLYDAAGVLVDGSVHLRRPAPTRSRPS